MFAVFFVSNVIKEVRDDGLPEWAFTAAVIVAPAVTLATRTAIHALGAAPSPVGEWEGDGPLQGRRLFTGRQPVRVVFLRFLA
jgi:hypothetical protein